MDRSSYYDKRALGGMIEAETSTLKKQTMNNLKKMKKNRHDKDFKRSDEKLRKLPSPRTVSYFSVDRKHKN